MEWSYWTDSQAYARVIAAESPGSVQFRESGAMFRADKEA
jgi:hypothetical protein